MIVGVDLDNTITDLPEFFAVLTVALVAAGHQVHIIAYREVGTEDDVRQELKQLGIAYTNLHLPTGPCTPPKWKSELAGRLGLELMLEDSPEVLSAMPSSVKRLWVCDPDVFDLDLCIRALITG